LSSAAALLAEVRLRSAKPREKPYKLFDELGLFLLVMPNADRHKGRLWRLRYHYGKSEKLLSLGSYPDVPLKRAREKRDEARRRLADGVDPSAQRKITEESKAETFEAIAREWIAMRAKTTAAVTQQKALWLLEMLFPRIGKRPIREVTPPELLAALRKIEAKGSTRRRIALSRNAGRYSGMPSPPGVRSGTSALIYAVPWYRWSRETTHHSPTRRKSAPYSVRSMVMKGSPLRLPL
jgi:hypothetical protein